MAEGANPHGIFAAGGGQVAHTRKKNPHGIFAARGALMPTQEKKKKNSICNFRSWAGLSAHTRRKNYMCIGGKNISDYSFKGRESRPICITQ